ncbi:hypothetical protein LUX12_02415 [Streptomyces somaliensis]|uniref:hypothetical protein n=1 Tax=Streptomyces somaliensis TaxID=78355 RepID=UPI0020CEB6CD|nr:hypothetical protein [Streptomyces somaliensis]MCP9943915.1 hypothetical protein [Streptomyces somaliensis]
MTTEEYAELLPRLVGAVREAGALAGAAHRGQPVGGTTVEEMTAAFAAVDAPASGLLRDRTRALRPGARWAADEVGTRVAARASGGCATPSTAPCNTCRGSRTGA